MPRRNRPKGSRRPDEEADLPMRDLTAPAPPGWQVRTITRERATKTYRCPGCDREIRSGTAHVVVWRDGAEDERRHFHTPCWDREVKRGPGRY